MKWHSGLLWGRAGILILVLSSFMPVMCGAQRGPNETVPLTVQLTSDKKDYSLTEKIYLDVRLLNSGSEALTIFGLLRWGYMAGLTLHVTDSAGKEVYPKFLDDDMIHPNTLRKRSSYILLEPHHYLGETRSELASDLVRTAGTYFVYIDYKVPISKKEGKGPNFWSDEKPMLSSNKVEIHVRSLG